MASKMIVSFVLASAGLLEAAGNPNVVALERYRPMMLAEYFLRTGIMPSIREFAQIPLVFTIIDSLEQPVPGGALEIVFPESTVTRRADSLGCITIQSDSVLLRRDPILQTTGVKQKFEFSLALSRGSGTLSKPVSVVNPERMMRREAGEDIVWYSAGYDTVGEPLARQLPLIRQVIREVTGFEPPAWGVLLSDRPMPVVACPGQVRRGALKTQVFPFAITDEGFAWWYLGNVSEWTMATLAANLDLSDPRTRWVATGIAAVVEERLIQAMDRREPARAKLAARARRELQDLLDYLTSLKPETRGRVETDLELMRRGSLNPADGTLNAAQRETRWVLSFDLLNWYASDPKHPVSYQDFLGAQLAGWYWWRLTEKRGAKLPSEFLARAKTEGARDNDAFLVLLTALTGDPSPRSGLVAFDTERLEKDTRERMSGY